MRFKNLSKKLRSDIMSATPEFMNWKNLAKITEQIVRPTGLLDPKISVRKSENQIKDLTKESKLRMKRSAGVGNCAHERMAEDLADFLKKKV